MADGHLHFNPRSPYGERRCEYKRGFAGHFISIHAPRTGSDSGAETNIKINVDFNPRSPYGERPA